MPGKKEKLSLSVTHPELAKEAYGWDPKIWVNDRAIKMDWLCSVGHKYETIIKNRKRGSGCPKCSKSKTGKKVRAPINKGKEIQPLGIKEVKRLLETYKGTFMSARLHIALLCGLRKGESLGLRWQDINLDDGLIEVRSQLSPD